ncbi:MAG TPA: hypothetical protein VM694_43730 [Polyangium sp.]|nr:hypothetical protein [Polyangium sp.]
MAFLTTIPVRALMAMTAGLLLFVACGDEGGNSSDGSGGTGGSLAGATKRCGQDVGCQPGETCKLNFIEWGYECACENGKLVCDSWSGAAGPPAAPPTDPGVECDDSYCQDNNLASSCSFASATCNYEVMCNLGTGMTDSVTGDCP